MLATVYAEVVKNLELAKFTLSQETPVIQIVDESNLPLQKNKENKILTTILVAFLFSFLLISYMLIKNSLGFFKKMN
jgi:uncharacterized protein involved in exopolysaccharide biosynthesis